APGCRCRAARRGRRASRSSRDSNGSHQRAANGFQNTVDILDDVVVPEAQHAKACLLEKLGAPRVLLRSRRMLAAIQFNNEPLLVTDKVGGKSEDRLLAAELRFLELAVAQPAPEQLLHIGGIAPQPPRALGLRRRRLPLCVGSQVPLSPWGEGRGEG